MPHCPMIKQLKDMAGMHTDTRIKGYSIMKYPHPDANKRPEFIENVKTLEEAQEICSSPESSYKEGPTKNWYFLGYTEAGSRTGHITIWDAIHRS